MNQDELIEKCRLTDEELERLHYAKRIYTSNWFQDALQAQLRKAIPIIQKAEREKVFADLEDMELLKGHNHKKDEIKLVACARCTYDWYKEQALKGEG